MVWSCGQTVVRELRMETWSIGMVFLVLRWDGDGGGLRQWDGGVSGLRG